MGKKSVIFLVILLSIPVLSRPFTTKQMRENTLRINAMETEEVTPQTDKAEIPEVPGEIVLHEERLLFDFDKSVVKEEYYGELQKVADIVNKTGVYISITGYTDSKGTDEYNDKLSYRRAQAVYEKLLEFGLSKNQVLEIKGLGKRNPVTSDIKPDGSDNPDGRAQNRRIIIDIIEK